MPVTRFDLAVGAAPSPRIVVLAKHLRSCPTRAFGVSPIDRL